MLFDDRSDFLDYGCGHGIFIRLMRDRGISFFGYDKADQIVFAEEFQVQKAESKQFEMVTAFEVFEHLEHPIREIEGMLSFSRNLLFTTELVPSNEPMPGEWWYFGLDHGQHISFYTLDSLRYIAEKYNLNLYSDRIRMHILTEKKGPFDLYFSLAKKRILQLLDVIFSRRTFLATDFQNQVKRGHLRKTDELP